MGLLLHHLQTTPTPPHLLRRDLNLPPGLSMMLMRALEKDPAKRFQSANEMLEALANAKKTATDQTGIATRVITPTVMASAGTPLPETLATTAMAAAAAPAYAPTVAAPKPASAAIDKTIAIAPPRRPVAPAPRAAAKPSPSPQGGRRWLVPVLILLVVVGALGMMVRQQRKKAAEASKPVATQPATQPETAPPAAPPVENTATPAKSETVSKPEAPKKKAVAEKPVEQKPLPQEPQPQAEQKSEPPPAPMSSDVKRLLLLGRQQYENKKYGAAMASFRAALDLDPKNQWALRGIELCKEARQQQSEQVLQQGQSTDQQQGNVPRWKRRRPN
jgi:serine/threonine-protein kinase